MPNYFTYVLTMFYMRAGWSEGNYYSSWSSSNLRVLRIRARRYPYAVLYHRQLDHPRLVLEAWRDGQRVWQDRLYYVTLQRHTTYLRTLAAKDKYPWDPSCISDYLPNGYTE